MKATLILVCLAAAVIQAPLFGATLLTMQRDFDQTSPSAGAFTVTIDGSLLRIDSQSGGEPSVIIFRAEQGELVLVDSERRIYTVIEHVQVESVAAQAQPGYANAPAEPLQSALPQGKQPNELRTTSEVRTVNGYGCVVNEGYREGQKVRETCVADWQAISSGGAVQDTLAALSEFARDLTQAFRVRIPMGGSLQNPFADTTGLGGFPVLAIGIDDGRALWSTSLLSVESVSTTPATFEPPAGYTRHGSAGFSG